MSDGMVIWETPAARKTLLLRTTATAILGVKEDNHELSNLYIGDKLGQLHVINLPHFELDHTSPVSDSALRAMCMDEHGSLIVADAIGKVWSVDDVGKPKLMFDTKRSISSLLIEGNTIRIQSGWEQCLYSRNGELANSKDASKSFGENLMLRRMRERKALEVQRREAEAQLRLLPSV
jgi:hypothetical protein